jgi:uncharacterized protein YqjF (DUF2071 family)
VIASGAARERLRAEGGPLFLCAWKPAIFLHYAVDPAALAPRVPFPLDLRRGRAFVSLVAFTQIDARPPRGGRAAAFLTRPCATLEFLNVRTYVRHGGEPGIHFLAEWIPGRLPVLIGPRWFGLPCRPAMVDYDHGEGRGTLRGEVVPGDAEGRVRWRVDVPEAAAPRTARPGSLAEFLCERYAAFTMRRGRAGVFRIWHEPWPLLPARAVVLESGPLATTGDWLPTARFLGGQVSPGVPEVWVGPSRGA